MEFVMVKVFLLIWIKMYILDGLNGEKKKEKALIFLMILVWESKEIGRIVNVFMANGYFQMVKFIKEILKIISLMAMVIF